MPRTLPFYKLSPGGNPTILVHDNALFTGPRNAARRTAIARDLMDMDHIGAEQVGFLDTSREMPHMEMMGGEFCCNATRSAGLVFALLDLLPVVSREPDVCEGTITTSGADGAVRLRVTTLPVDSGHSPATARDVAVAIPLPAPSPAASGPVLDCSPGETLVRLPGIVHLLLDTDRHPLPENPLAAAAATRAACSLDNEEAAGVIWHAACPDTPGMRRILPVVHVRATGSSVAETACGSGSLALALALARNGGNPFVIRQPSGHDITIRLEPSLAWVSGTVLLRGQGTAYTGGHFSS